MTEGIEQCCYRSSTSFTVIAKPVSTKIVLRLNEIWVITISLIKNNVFNDALWADSSDHS